ncbi:recombinase family protein [Pseudomonas fulva]|nr:recombinase family protein [Pseudomonas fulva]
MHRLSRLARSLANLLKLVEHLTNPGVHVCCEKEKPEFTG